MKYLQLLSAIESTSQRLLARAVATVNQALVVRNWVVGAYLVESEQHGKDRARYGAQLMQRLAADLAKRGLKGLGASSLKNYRQFYPTYPQIRQPLVGESAAGETSAPVVRKSQAEAMPPPKQVASSVRRRVDAADLPLLSPEFVLRFSWSKLLELSRRGTLAPSAREEDARTLASLQTSHHLRTPSTGPGITARRLQAAVHRNIEKPFSHLEKGAQEAKSDAATRLRMRGDDEAECMRRLLEEQQRRVQAELGRYDHTQLLLSLDLEKRQLESNRRYWDKWLGRSRGQGAQRTRPRKATLPSQIISHRDYWPRAFVAATWVTAA